MALIDSHAHLDDEAFDRDRGEVLNRARENGVVALVTVGTDLESSRRARAIAEAESDVWFAPGIHPHEADRSLSAEVLEDLARHPRAVAVGETGLDFFKRYAAPENQERLFRSHLALARAVEKPVIIHCREAHREVYDILRAEEVARGVIHCFSGTAVDAEKYLALGFYLSIAGPITYPNAARLREAVKSIPLERMLVETDCPLLTPQAHRGTRNEPGYVRFTADEIARVLGCSLEEVALRTTENSRRLFRLARQD